MSYAETFNIIIFLAALLIILISCFLEPNRWYSKITSIVAVLVGSTLIVTGMLRLVPGDPIDHILGDQAPYEARIKLATDLGLLDANQNPTGFIAQYGQFIRQVFKNELRSYRTHDPVFTMIKERLPYTIWLAFFAMLFALTLGPILGVISAYKKNTFTDGAILFFTLLSISIPRFFLGPLLLLAFSISLHWFPVSGATDGVMSVILPALSLGLAMAAIQARMIRASVLEVVSEDYIRTARAKGLSEKNIFLKHALRNALMPIVTIVGLELGGLLAGTVVTEKIFNWPGIGLLLLESIQRLDMPVVQGVVLTIAFSYVFINFITDLLYQWIDPRVKI